MNARAWKEALFADRGRMFGEFFRGLLAGIPWSERAEATKDLTLPAPENGSLRIDNPHGRTRVIGEERSDVRVLACKVVRAESREAAEQLAREIGLRSSHVGGGTLLELDVPRRWNRAGQVHLEIRVPRELRIDVSAANGRVQVEGLRAPLRARSSNGAVCASDVIGDIEIEASNARIGCARCVGRLLARSANGKIQLEGHRGSIDASTSNGLIHAKLTELRGAGVRLATSNGRIVLELPEEVDANLDLRVDNGLIRAQRSLGACTRKTASRLVGRLGRGGIPIQVCATNGSISLR